MQNPNPNPTLSDALASLSSLVALSDHTLTTLSDAFPDLAALPKGGLDDESRVHCPFDPRHVVPPEWLFRHHLSCHTPLGSGSDSEIIGSPNYCRTLGLSGEADRRKDGFMARIAGGGDEDARFCFGVDEFLGNSGRNFFYEGCPGVVEGDDGTGSGRMFTLPGVLAVECADFPDDTFHDVGGGGTFEGDQKLCERGVLPSGYWRVRMELDGWVDSPSSYSCNMLHVILSLGKLNGDIFRRYLIGKSPQYGVIVDGAMADHMLVLFRLCAKAIMREGVRLVNELAVNGKNRPDEGFACPHLVIGMAWLASQFSILYGVPNGKLFSIDLLKRCMGKIAESISMYKHVDNLGKPSDNIECAEETKSNGSNSEDGDKDSKMKEVQLGVDVVENFCGEVIYVPRVVAAVAALHERSLMERKIRASLQLVPLSSYQRIIEHANITNRANEERKKRPDYKPIIDHDGLPRLPVSSQETNKTKTIEELLAEERDYKRRRMSYRGKKSNRNPSGVMRGIIEGYMEEINQAGGIGCFDKSADVISVNSSSNISREGGSLADYRASLSSADREDFSSVSFHDRSKQKTWTSTHYVEHSNDEVEICDEAKQDRKHHPYSPEISRRKYSREHRSRLSEGGDGAGLKYERKRSGTSRSKYEERTSPSKRGEDRSRWKSEHKDKLLNTRVKHSSDFLVENGFEDRYDPSESDDFVH
ncbi:hypothetical protein MLD38_018591 [Melastoma candidum]|uniref:Uncharacterized protein n=1 Tax=Melastoma candidum TaxID=119954 RepID=A0ACB9QXF0_9MYRT|nr:hypothetical protein MLD38_018591 [Melastoma candidum]